MRMRKSMTKATEEEHIILEVTLLKLKDTGNRVEYSTIYVTITEEQSEYVDAVLVKFSELVTKFLNSLNNLLKWLVGLIPYAAVAALVWLGWKKFKKTDSVKKK